MIVYENPWFKVIKQDNYHFVEELNAKTGAAVLAIRGDSILLLKMQRLSQGLETTLEIPRGYAEAGETSRECAIRELREETGYCVPHANLHLLGHIRPNTGLLTTRVALFFAQISESDVPSQRDNEAAALLSIKASEISSYLSSGQIEDSFTLAALCYLKYRDEAQ
jgi:ADP-ribose pyrophosphatase